MKIRRTTANSIMSRALHNIDYCMLGIMDDHENIVYADSTQQMSEFVQQHIKHSLIFNQHAEAIEFIDLLPRVDGQHSIEIFQDTDGVFGLRAYCQLGLMQTPEILELSD